MNSKDIVGNCTVYQWLSTFGLQWIMMGHHVILQLWMEFGGQKHYFFYRLVFMAHKSRRLLTHSKIYCYTKSNKIAVTNGLFQCSILHWMKAVDASPLLAKCWSFPKLSNIVSNKLKITHANVWIEDSFIFHKLQQDVSIWYWLGKNNKEVSISVWLRKHISG